MKKLLILVIALALVGGIAMADVTLSGQVETRMQRELDGGGKYSSIDARVQVNAQVDEYNSAVIRFRFSPTPTITEELLATGELEDAGSQFNAVIDRAHVTTDLGALLGSGDIGLKWNTGWNEWGYADVAEIDAYNWSGLALPKPANIGTKLMADLMGMANLHAAVVLAADRLVADNEQAVIGLDTAIDVGVGTAVAELVYVYNTDDDKRVGVAAGLLNGAFVPDMELGLATAWTFYLDAEDPAADWSYNVALQAGYAGLATADFVLVGDENSEANALGIALGLTPVDFASLQFGVGIGLDDDVYEEAFDSFDASVQVKAGALGFRLGYYWLNDDGAGLVPAEYARTNAYSGIYARAMLSF